MVGHLLVVIGNDVFDFTGPEETAAVKDLLSLWRDARPSADQGTAQVLADIKALQEGQMNQNEKVEALSTRLDAATNEIAADMTSLREEVRNGKVSDESLAKLDANIARLEGLGQDQDPTNPVPPVEPPVVTEPVIDPTTDPGTGETTTEGGFRKR